MTKEDYDFKNKVTVSEYNRNNGIYPSDDIVVKIYPKSNKKLEIKSHYNMLRMTQAERHIRTIAMFRSYLKGMNKLYKEDK